VYVFRGEGGAPLYVGMSRNLRTRVLQHFTARLHWAAEVRRIDWQRTVGELGALLREAQLVKELQPAYNRQLRRPQSLCGFAFDMKRLRLVQAHEIDAQTLPYLHGLFRSRRDAHNALRALADEYGLCLQALGIDAPRAGPCFRFQVRKCGGVCAGKENIHVHHGRAAEALARLKAVEWPHAGALGIVEADREREATEVHVVDRWCYLGSARDDGELAELLEAGRPPFDYDHYRILARHLGKKGVRTMALPACTAS
jgi:DNA polymerase-3 subunit epsilon